MTSRERLLAAFRREPVDRVPVRLWSLDSALTHSQATASALQEIDREYHLDLLPHWSPGLTQTTAWRVDFESRPSPHGGFIEETTTIHTPLGPLVSSEFSSTEGKPGYHAKYLLESPEDAEKWLSLPWTPPIVDCSDWPGMLARVGDRGMPLAGCLAEAMFAINDLTGSETWGYWLVEERELLHRLVAEANRRRLIVVKEMLGQGARGVYGYVGPEVCIPPLASPRDFREFVVQYDQPVHDLIHDAGGMVWVHCHGKMNLVLEGLADCGIDCLNPMEPPPMGDVTIAEARRRVGDRMTFEGGIEVADLELKTPTEMAAMVAGTVWQSGGRGFILGLSSDLSHLLSLEPRVVENLRTFCEVGRREGERVCAA